MRFGERLQFAIQADAELMDLQVPSFSIQPLVENAVKYSVDSEHAAGRVDIEVVTEVITEQDRALIVRVLDDGVGLGSSVRKPASLGMAVDNVRERLRRLFGDRAALDLTSRDEGGVEARLRLPALRVSTQVQAS